MPTLLDTSFVPSEIISPAPYDCPDFTDLKPVIAPKAAYTVLIADDNSINRRLLIALINKHNMRYLEAVNGLQALQLYKRYHESINVVLMDISMPVLDGMTSTRLIRAFESKEKLDKTMVIALTGLVSASARLEALESGVNEFMTKPVNFGKLIGLMPGLAEVKGGKAKENVVKKETEVEKEKEINGIVTPPGSDQSGSSSAGASAGV